MDVRRETKFDAVIIGGGHNGLVCAAYLAKAGRKVCVLERRHVLGGCATTEELWPGYKVSTAAYVISLFLPQIIRELQLKQYGLTILPRNPSSFTPLPDGRSLLLGPDAGLCRARDRQVQHARCRRVSAVQRASGARRRRARAGAQPGRARSAAAARRVAQDRPRQTPARRQENVGALPRAQRARRRPAAGGRAAHRRGPADPRPLVRERRAQGHARHRRDHRRVPLDQLARQRVRAAAPRDGRSRRRSRRVGLRARRHGRARRRRSKKPATISASRSAAKSPVQHILTEQRPRDRRPARRRHAASMPRSSPPASTRISRSRSCSTPAELPEDFRDAVARIDYSSASAKINLALAEPPRFTCMPDAPASWPAPSRHDAHRPVARIPGTRLRRRQVRPPERASRSSKSRCPPASTARSPRPASTSSSCSCSTRRTNWPSGNWDDIKEKFADRCIEDARRVRTECARRDRASASALAARSGAHVRHHRRQHHARRDERRTSSSASAPSPAGPTTARRSAACTCAAPPATPAAASSAPAAKTRPKKSCAIFSSPRRAQRARSLKRSRSTNWRNIH